MTVIKRHCRPVVFQTKIDNGQVKITWDAPNSSGLLGSFVVRNRFHPPRSPFDGVKLYAGNDEYTYDKFGNPNILKYYSVFSYDNVPNYSAPACVHFSLEETIPVIEVDPEEVETQQLQSAHTQRG